MQHIVFYMIFIPLAKHSFKGGGILFSACLSFCNSVIIFLRFCSVTLVALAILFKFSPHLNHQTLHVLLCEINSSFAGVAS